MGVLRLFRYLLTSFGSQFYRSLHPSSPAFRVDMLLIDLNAIFHPAAREIYFPPVKDLLRAARQLNQPPPTDEQLERQAFDNILKYIEAIIQVCPPKRVLYLAIDGVAGMCKQSQQRKRRYKAAKERQEQLANADPAYLASISNGSTKEPFNMANITAGTPWMARLCAHIAQWIQTRKTSVINGVNLSQVRVIYNDMYVPGEGEHKLIRYLSKECHPRASYCVYSPDADLIMLCMCLSNGRGYILRENIYDDVQGKWILVDCTKLKSIVCTQLSESESDGAIECDHQQRLVSDYVLFLMLIGNDFLPNLYCLEIGNQGIETLQTCYAYLRSMNLFLVNSVFSLEQQAFVVLFEQLASYEPGLILSKRHRRVKFPDSLLATHLLLKTIVKNEGAPEECKIQVEELDFASLRQEYYRRKFASEFTDWSEDAFEANVTEIVKHFIRGLNFVMTYYAIRIPSFAWCYEHHYAPLMADIHQVATRLNSLEWAALQSFEYKDALTLNQALLGIIPPSSRSVCSASVMQILEKHAQHELFSEQFEVDLEGKQQDYEGICLLPNVPYTSLKKLCKEKSNHSYDPAVF